MPNSTAPKALIETPELTVRAVLTGMVIGALLAPCNVYSGLKIGWTFNMSVAAGLIAYAFWSLSSHVAGTRPLLLLENNINQTAASSAASIISAGLAAPIPALTLLTGQTLAYPVLAAWLFVVSALGIVVAAGLREQLLLRDRLPFPAGIVTAETMREIHSGGAEARARLRLLSVSALVSGAAKIITMRAAIGPLAPPLSTSITTSTAPASTVSVSAMNLGFALDPSVLMVGFGAISGLRIGLSALIGAVVSWGILAPMALAYGWVKAGEPDAGISWFGPLVEWLLWPGATLMVVASLTSFAISIWRLIIAKRRTAATEPLADASSGRGRSVSRRHLLASFLVTGALAVYAQLAIFDIGWLEAIVAVCLSFVLAIVAARVSGETAITPIGALGKITQLTFGALSPGNVTSNLMSANVTGGAAGQCADLMHDLKTGHLLSATPRFQFVAQLFGVLTGALAASWAYILLFPDPKNQLITAEWPAPAVATWKAVAEVLSAGLSAMPPAALPAIVIAAILGILFAVLESFVPERIRPYIPSASAMGLGFVIPAWNSISLFLGAMIGTVLTKFYPDWARRRLVVLAAGLIVGESLAGVLGAVATMLI